MDVSYQLSPVNFPPKVLHCFGLGSTFQPPEEGRSVQRPKRCDTHGYIDENNSPKNVNNISSCRLNFRRSKK